MELLMVHHSKRKVPKVTESDKHPIFLKYKIIYDRKKFYSTGRGDIFFLT
jgi:hypothetical protein